METSLKIALDVVELLARCDQKLLAFAAAIERHKDVRAVKTGLQCRIYEPRPMLEGYVDAELISDRAMTWWIEASWSPDNCEVNASVLIVTEKGQDALRSRELATVASFDALAHELTAAIEWLREESELLDVAADYQPGP